MMYLVQYPIQPAFAWLDYGTMARWLTILVTSCHFAQDALTALLAGEADAMWVYADQAKNYQCAEGATDTRRSQPRVCRGKSLLNGSFHRKITAMFDIRWGIPSSVIKHGLLEAMDHRNR